MLPEMVKTDLLLAKGILRYFDTASPDPTPCLQKESNDPIGIRVCSLQIYQC
jgi:hypothetical protein